MSEQKDDVAFVLNYYTPYVSGLTNVARDLAEGLAARGRRVSVVTSQHDPGLPLRETVNGVCVVRTPVALRIGKGVISPQFVTMARTASRHAKVVNIHAPMLEAGLVTALSEAPVVLTYQCDVSLPPTVLGRAQNVAMDLSTRWSARRAAAVTVSSEDYAEHSRVAEALRHNQVVLAPTCHDRRGGRPTLRDGDGLHVGFLGRIVEEKGIEYLVDGFRALDAPDARLLIAGDFSRVAGGSVIDRVRERIGQDGRIRLLGFLPDEQLEDFYASIDVFALPSVNPFEAFGIVQVEAMMAGVPSLASDMPGVRQPVLRTGMGEIVQTRSAESVTAALRQLARGEIDREDGARRSRELYSLESTLDQYEELIDRVAAER